jgi:hypothetical protein
LRVHERLQCGNSRELILADPSGVDLMFAGSRVEDPAAVGPAQRDRHRPFLLAENQRDLIFAVLTQRHLLVERRGSALALDPGARRVGAEDEVVVIAAKNRDEAVNIVFGERQPQVGERL